MRLRLDKLVLSAGLALAMVATSIPAIAGTKTETTKDATGLAKSGTTLSIDNTAVTSANKDTEAVADNVTFIKDATGKYIGATAVNTISGYTGTVSQVAVKTVAAPTAVAASAGEEISSSMSENGEKLVTSFTVAPYEIEVTNTYSKTVSKDVTVDATGDTAVESAVSTAITAIEDAEKDWAAVGTGTSTVTAASAASQAEVEKTDATETAITEAGNASAVADANEKLTGLTFTVTRTTTTTYTISSLPTDYTYDYVTENVTLADNEKYTAYSQDSSNANAYVVGTDVTVTKTNSDADLKVQLSELDANVSYFIVSKVVSTSEKLLTGNTAVDGYTIDFKQTNGLDDETAKSVIDNYISTNGYTKVAYLSITVTDISSNDEVEESTTDFTFTIDVPTDIGTDGITYTVLRLHGGVVEPLTTTVADGKITFTSNKFSDFALVYTAAAEDPTQEEQQSQEQQSGDATPAGGSGSSGTSENGASSKTADNSMMPLFMKTLLLALCAGSLAIYKEKKTN